MRSITPLRGCKAGLFVPVFSSGTGTRNEFLLDQKLATLQDVDRDGRTALHHLCRGGHYKAVVMALLRGAEPLFRDGAGYTPFDALLDEIYSSWGSPTRNLTRVLWVLCELGVGEERQQQGWSALHAAVDRQPASDLIPQLLKQKHEIFNGEPWQPLTHRGRPPYDLTLRLIDAFRGTNARDSQGRTLLHVLLGRWNCQPADIWDRNLRLLLENGADPTIQDHSGVSALGCYVQAQSALAVQKQLSPLGQMTLQQLCLLEPTQQRDASLVAIKDREGLVIRFLLDLVGERLRHPRGA